VRSATSRRSGSRAGAARLDSRKVRAARRRSLGPRARAPTSMAHLRRGPDFGEAQQEPQPAEQGPQGRPSCHKGRLASDHERPTLRVA
jgi:hypothetical protein